MSSQPRANPSLGRNRLLTRVPAVHVPQSDSQQASPRQSQMPSTGKGKRRKHPMMPREPLPQASQPPADQEPHQNQQHARRKHSRSSPEEGLEVVQQPVY